MARTRSSQSWGSQEVSYADQLRIQALQEYQQRLAEPVTLNNDILIDFSSRMIAEMSMRPYKTALTIHGQTFTADEFIDWAMTQSEIRDQCDALFVGNELLSRGVFLPVSYGTTDALFWTPTLKSGSSTFRLVCKKKAQVIAAVYGKQVWHRDGDVAGSAPPSETNSPSASGKDLSANGDAVRRSASATAANGDGPAPRPKGILKRSKTAPVDDIADFEEFRRLRFLPRFARLRAFRAKNAVRRRAAATRKAAGRAVHVACAPARATGRYLESRLGPHLLFAVALPWIVAWFFPDNAALTWLAALFAVRHVAVIDARQRRAVERRVRAEELGKFQGRRGHAKLHKDGSETADWWSEVLRSFWEGWLEFWLNRLLTRILTNVLDKVKPAYLEMLEITTFKLGDVAPRINSSRCWRGNEGETILEWDLVWQTQDMQITLSAKVGGAKFAVPVPLRVFINNLRIAGKFRLGLFWTRRKGGPYLQKLRLSFVDMPEHSVSIKPVTSSFIDVRDLPGVDTAIENALNKLLTNLLVEPNCVTWDVEKWWINRPVMQRAMAAAGADGLPGSGVSPEELELMEEAERIRVAKESKVTSILAAGAGYSRAPTLTVAMSVHLAEIETREGAKPTSYYVKLKRGTKKYTTDGARATATETLVSAANDDARMNGGSQGGASSVGDDDEFHDASENATAHGRSASMAATTTTPAAARTSRGHGRRASDFAADYDPPAVVKKWMCRPVWEEFVRLDAFEVQIDTSVDIRVVTDDGAVVGSKTTVGRALIENVLDYADGRLHTVQLPIMNTRSGELVGVLHLRLRVAALNDDIIAANKDRNPNASLLTAPKTYTKQFALSAADVLSSGASGVAGAMRAGLGGALAAVPIPKKYTAAAAKSVRAAALKAVNEPARQGRWAFRSVYKGCKKMYLGKERYKAIKKEKVTRELEAAERAAGYADAWKSVATPAKARSAGERMALEWRERAGGGGGESHRTDASRGGSGRATALDTIGESPSAMERTPPATVRAPQSAHAEAK